MRSDGGLGLGGWPTRGGAARLRGEVSPEARAPPRRRSRAQGKGSGRTRCDTTDSTTGTVPAWGHQRAQSAAEPPNGGVDPLQRAIVRKTGQHTGK
jgi:hypothetical protein